MRQAPAYSHESQGSIERAHAALWQQVRALRGAAKDSYNGYDAKAYDELMAWLANYATWNYNICQEHRSMCEFAETPLYCRSRQHLRDAGAQWHYGIWLGKCIHSDDQYSGTAEGV